MIFPNDKAKLECNLKKIMPCHTFDVAETSFRGIGVIEVTWIDGPTVDQIDGIISMMTEIHSSIITTRTYSQTRLMRECFNIGRAYNIPIPLNIKNIELLQVSGATIKSVAIAELSLRSFYGE